MAAARPPRAWEPGGSIDGLTVSRLLRDRAAAEPGTPGLRRKVAGAYEDVAWGALWKDSRRVAIGLRAAGVKRGDRVGLMGVATLELLTAELAVWTAGAVSVGIYPTSAPAGVRFILEDSDAIAFVGEAPSHFAQLPAPGDVPLVRLRVQLTGEPAGGDVRTLDALRELGDRHEADLGPALDRDVERESPHAASCLTYTSGTTGRPKGVLHTHASILSGAFTKVHLVPALRERPQRSVVHLPIAHVSPKSTAILLPLMSRLVPHLAGDDDLRRAAREVEPTYLVQPPRFYEKLASELLVSVQRRSRARRALYRPALRVGTATVRHCWRGETPPLRLRAAAAVARLLVLKPLLREAGYHRLERAYVGSAPASPETTALWHAWGLDLRESYGLTEASGSVIAQQRPYPRPGTIGTAVELPGWEVGRAEDGELLIRASCNFLEYWKQPQETAAALKDGWFYTGDIVTIDERGEVTLVDRKKDLISTSGGKTVSPQQIERELKAGRYVAEAIVVGEGRKFLAALIEVDAVALGDRLGIDASGYEEIVARPEVEELVAAEVEQANRQLGRVEQIKRFRLLPIPLASLDGILTPTRKVKRKLVASSFAELIEAMYADELRDVAEIRGQTGSLLLPDTAT
jgi:long-chain acyl-CoA synthetase